MSPGQLVRILAALLGLPVATLVVHDRNLVMAGLRSKSGRGRGAARVSARDAAHVLTAALGSGHVKDSVATVERYALTRACPTAGSQNGFEPIGLPELSALAKAHSFVDALEALIVSASTGALAQRLDDARDGTPARRIDVAPLIEIAALTPGTLADIRIAGPPSLQSTAVRYMIPARTHGKGRKPSGAPDDPTRVRHAAGDLEQFRRISAQTIIRLGEALEGEGEDP